PDESLARARRMLDQGADWIDLGAESTRPVANCWRPK
ncbi:MAG: dihydropteroate synthase, partial [Betaproteobacteria bacterium]|nr:dihydropteroate synthase [Betaproteobacteria bacterium]